MTHLVTLAEHVAHGVFAVVVIMALVVEAAIDRAPTLESKLGRHEHRALRRAVLPAHL